MPAVPLHLARRASTPHRRARAGWLGVTAVAVLLASCGTNPNNIESGQSGQPGASSTEIGGTPTTAGGGATGGVTTGAPVSNLYPGMPPVPDGNNLYSEVKPGNRSPATKDALARVYVPNEVSGTVSVIDPATMQVIDTYQSGFIPQHVVPAYDLMTLYALNNSSDTILPIDPKTGKGGKPIKVEDPYNLYFTPDGKEAIVVEEEHQTLTFTDPKTFEKHQSYKTACDGMNHMDFSIDGRYALVTCEFEGTMVKFDLVNRTFSPPLKLDMSASGMKNPIKKITQPQDVRVSPDGKVFYVADLITDGVYLIDGESFTQIGFIPTGIGTHGLYPSRDGKKLYVINRGTETIPAPGSFKGKGKGSVSVLDFATRKVEANWPVPNGGSPDMGNLTEDGTQLWLGGRYDAEVYVFDTVKGELIKRIPVGQNPHGLTVWPQPGRYSLGHTGNMR